jgi:hypothetical protein
MVKKSKTVRPVLPPPPELHALEEYRLIHGLTYRALTDDIETTTQFHRSIDGWRQICQGVIGASRRTQFIIDLYFQNKGYTPSVPAKRAVSKKAKAS